MRFYVVAVSVLGTWKRRNQTSNGIKNSRQLNLAQSPVLIA